MKDSTIFTLFSGGGFGVIISYLFLYLFSILPTLANCYNKWEWRFWVFSMIITTISVIALIVWFSFYQNLQGQTRELFIASLATFLAFAMLWSLCVAYIVKENKNPNLQRPILLVVGLATIGLLLATIYNTDNWLIITAAAIIVWHHLIIDGFWWPNMHARSYLKTRSVKNKGRPKKGQNV